MFVCLVTVDVLSPRKRVSKRKERNRERERDREVERDRERESMEAGGITNSMALDSVVLTQFTHTQHWDTNINCFNSS